MSEIAQEENLAPPEKPITFRENVEIDGLPFIFTGTLYAGENRLSLEVYMPVWKEDVKEI